MSWQVALEELFTIGSRLMKTESAATGSADPLEKSETAAAGGTVVRWFQKPGNVDALITASEQVRAEHRKLVAQLQRKRARGEPYTAAEMERLVDLTQADTQLSKEALLTAGSPEQILKYTVGVVLPWILLLGRLALLVVSAAGVPVAFVEQEPDSEPESEPDTEADLEAAVLAALVGTRPLAGLAAELGISRAELLRRAERYSTAGLAALREAIEKD